MNPVVVALLFSQTPTLPPAFPIRQVVVFEDRAEVRRVGRISCTDGKAEVELSDLSSFIRSDSIRATVSRGEVLAVRAEVTSEGPKLDSNAKTELQSLKDKMQRLQDRILGEQDALQRLGVYAGLHQRTAAEVIRSARPDLNKLGQGYEAFLAERLRRTRRERSLHEDVAKVSRTIAKLEAELARAGSTRRRSSVKVLVGCEGAGTLEVAYVVPHATWEPVYDFHFEPKAKHGLGVGQYRLGVSARVRQSTGEDWRGVQLSLSTARPRLAADAPLPAPFHVRAQPKSKDKVLVQARERRPRLAAGAQGGDGARRVQVRDRGQVVLLEVPHPVNVGSDGRHRFIPVDALRGPAKAGLVAVPARSRMVFREARFRSKAAYTLLPGEVRLHRGGARVGRGRLPLLPAGAEARLSLGPTFDTRRDGKTSLTSTRFGGCSRRSG